jgi:hypothetical protein
MSYIRDINPLSVHGMRRLDHCPPHFERIVFDLYTDEKNITDWVYVNCAGRFFFGDYYSIDAQNRRQMCKLLAFENHSEASYFGLFADQLNRRELW